MRCRSQHEHYRARILPPSLSSSSAEGGADAAASVAQAHRRLDARVTQIARGRLLPKDDAEIVHVVRLRFKDEGINVVEHADVKSVEPNGNGIAVEVGRDGTTGRFTGSHLMVAIGRRPNVGGLDLEAAGVAHTQRGITVDDRLRTSNRRVFAIGDVAGGYQFTHMAAYHAGIQSSPYQTPAFPTEEQRALIKASDAAGLPVTSRAIWVGAGGDLAVELAEGALVVLAGVPGGTLVPVRARAVRAAGTTAGALVALW